MQAKLTLRTWPVLNYDVVPFEGDNVIKKQNCLQIMQMKCLPNVLDCKSRERKIDPETTWRLIKHDNV